MTVVEIIVVMSIIATIMGLGASMIGLIGASDLRKDANRLASVIRYTYSNAGINNTRYRLVLDFESSTYFTEITDQALISNSERTQDEEMLTEEARELGRQNDKKTDLFDEDEENPFGVNRRVTFQRVQDAVVEDEKLGEGVKFDKVYSPRFPNEPVTQGRMALSFFPNGYTEPVLIILKDENGAAYSLLTEPMTGQIRMYSTEIEPPPGFGEVETEDDY
jgi:Tfp pilus assembly protein FimT